MWPPDMTCLVLQVVLRIVLHGRDIRERIGALKVLQAFCVANKEGQQALISTITLPSASPRQGTQDGLMCWHSGTVQMNPNAVPRMHAGQVGTFGSELMQSLLDTTPGALQVCQERTEKMSCSKCAGC